MNEKKEEYATDINLKFRKKNKPDNPLNYKNMSRYFKLKNF